MHSNVKHSESLLESSIIESNDLAMSNLKSKHINHVLFYLNQALLKSKSLSTQANQDRMLALTYNNLACYFEQMNNPTKALEFLFRAISLMSVDKDLNNLSSAHLNVCSILSAQGQHERALRHALKSIYILRNKSGSASCLIKAYQSAAVQYKKINQIKDAQQCYKDALSISKSCFGPKHKQTLKISSVLEALSYSSSSSISVECVRVPSIQSDKSEKDSTRNWKKKEVKSLRIEGSKKRRQSPEWSRKKRNGVIKIQAWWRGWLVRRAVKRVQAKRKAIAQRTKEAIEQLESLKRLAFSNSSIPSRAVKKTRSYSPNKKIDRDFKALIKIQSAIKMFIIKQRYKRVLKACITIQRFFKAKGKMHLFQKIKSAVSFIQHMYRKYKHFT